MTEHHTSNTLSLLMPTAVSLVGIGILTLATPLFCELSRSQWLIDGVVGVLLVACGILCGFFGRKSPSE